MSNLSLELANHIGLVLHEEGSTVLSHPTVMHFMQLFHVDPLEDSLPKVVKIYIWKLNGQIKFGSGLLTFLA